jgi:hypothetical protein
MVANKEFNGIRSIKTMKFDTYKCIAPYLQMINDNTKKQQQMAWMTN